MSHHSHRGLARILVAATLLTAKVASGEAGRPSQEAIDASTKLIEWTLDVNLSGKDRMALEHLLVDAWRKGEQADIQSTVDAWKRIASMSEDQRRELRRTSNAFGRLQQEAGAGDAIAQWALKVHERTHTQPVPPTAARKGPAGIDLLPCRAGAWAVAVPRGWTCAADQGSGVVLQSSEGEGSAIAMGQRPPNGADPTSLLAQLIAGFAPARLVSRDVSANDPIATAVLDPGDGTRVVIDVRATYDADERVLRVAVAKFGNSNTFERLGGQPGFVSVVTSMHRATGLRAADLVGKWEFTTSQALYNVYNGGVWSGTADSGDYIQLTFDGRRYHLVRYGSSSGMERIWDVKEQSGAYETDGSTITLHPSNCEKAGQIGNRPVQKRRCEGGPYAILVTGTGNGKLVLSSTEMRDIYRENLSTATFERAARR
jgi:hypothetical protein